MSKCSEIRDFCGDYAFDVEYSEGNEFTMFFNSRRNAETVKRCIEVDDSVPNAATAVDFVEVVRCKDCKHRNPNGYKCLRDNLWHKDEDYCSCGEKKGDPKMRDRLITKIMQAKSPVISLATAEKIADHLLSEGVIAPPCKVGDKVYYHKAELNETCPTKVIEIHNNYYTPSMPLWITIEYESKLVGRQVERMASEVFVMLCRSTAEEAEKALAEREKDVNT